MPVGRRNVAVTVYRALRIRLLQPGNAAGVVVMVVGNPYLRQLQPVSLQIIKNGCGLARVYARGTAVVRNRPDIVVG